MRSKKENHLCHMIHHGTHSYSLFSISNTIIWPITTKWNIHVTTQPYGYYLLGIDVSWPGNLNTNHLIIAPTACGPVP